MRLSIVIPVFNDTIALPELLVRLFRMTDKQGHDAHVILVDDGSEGHAWQCLLDIKRIHAHKHITLLRLTRNCGQYAATLCGLMHCSADVAITMDADLQHPPEEIPKLLAEFTHQELDLVYGYSISGQPLSRRIGSTVFRAITRSIAGPGPRANASSFRVIRMAILKDLEDQRRKPFVSIDTLLEKRTQKLGSIDIRQDPRCHGRSAYTWRSLLITAFKTLYYSGKCGPAYLLIGLMFTILGTPGLTPDTWNITSFWGISRLNSAILVAIGLATTVFGRHLYRTGEKVSETPLFILGERVE